MSAPGKLHLLLHAHLPFVREPDYPRFLEENWFFEAMAETYLPLVQTLYRLEEKGIPGCLNLSFSSVLLGMLSDEMLLQKFTCHLHRLNEFIDKELKRLKDNVTKLEVAEFYKRRLVALMDTWKNRCQFKLIPALKDLEEKGKLNLITCIGTHPFLPAYQSDEEAIRLQLNITVRAFEEAFGKRPRGVWLPECGYFNNLDFLLAEFGFKYFFVETHGVLLAQPSPKYGVFAPIKTPAGLYCFGREQSSSMEVWSRKTGYPGHPEYREFFKDACREVSPEYLGDYFMAGSTPIETGLKYYRITGSEEKQVYRPWNALRLVEDHARLFIANREATINDLIPHMEGNKACILCPYDAELFGHWWFEGPLFIEKLFERAAFSNLLDMASLEESISNSPSECAPVFSSWGEGGFGEVWMNDEVSWMYPLFFRMRKMQDHLKSKAMHSKMAKRFWCQISREMVLFQASDWAFMIHNKSAGEYATHRMNEHYKNVCNLYQDAMNGLNNSGKFDTDLLKKLEIKNNIFPWIGD